MPEVIELPEIGVDTVQVDFHFVEASLHIGTQVLDFGTYVLNLGAYVLDLEMQIPGVAAVKKDASKDGH